MKKTLIAIALATLGSVAAAATYSINGTNGYATLATTSGQPTVSTYNFVLSVNDTTKLGNLAGSYSSGGRTYNLNINFLDPYTSGASQMWGDFSGTITGPWGFSRTINDTQGANNGDGRHAMDAKLGVNAAPYNTNSSLSNMFELGFWGSNADFNALARCTTPNTTVNANGSCGGSNGGGNPPPGGPGTGVPLPGTLALLGLGALALGLRRKN